MGFAVGGGEAMAKRATITADRVATAHGAAAVAFCLLGFVGCGCGPGMLLTGTFVGPHLVLGGLIWIAVGIAGLVVAAGLSLQARWARIAGIVLACAVGVTLGYAAICEISETARAGGTIAEGALEAAIPITFMILYPMVAIILLRLELSLRRRSSRDLTSDIEGLK